MIEYRTEPLKTNMTHRRITWKLLALSGLMALGTLATTVAHTADIYVMSSGGFTEAYKQLTPEFERSTAHKVVSSYGASMGGAPDSIPSRLGRDEPADVVILAAPALDALIATGKVRAGSRVDLVRSSIGMSVKAGSPKPDISTLEAFKNTLLTAQSIAYSASASGTYFSTDMLKKLGLAEQVLPKTKRIVSERVGTAVARGDAEIGLQQISELLPLPGLDFVGSIPAEVQLVTIFSAGIATNSKSPEQAQQLIKYLSSVAVAPTIAKTGLEPITAP